MPESLRSKIIRLAYQVEAARPHLLPLLRGASILGGTHVRTKDLPQTLQRALHQVGYRSGNIEVLQGTTFTYQDMGGDGQRAFVSAVNLESGQTKVWHGSWGGPNIYNKDNLVDLDDRKHPILMNMAVIQGTGGRGSTYAHVTVNPDNVGMFLPVAVDLTPEEGKALAIISQYTSAGRRSTFEYHRLGAFSKENPILQSLQQKGLVKFTGTGVQITVEGKNAVPQNLRNI